MSLGAHPPTMNSRVACLKSPSVSSAASHDGNGVDVRGYCVDVSGAPAHHELEGRPLEEPFRLLRRFP
eukprot:793321-Prorocentrum_minimum.AAC.1